MEKDKQPVQTETEIVLAEAQRILDEAHIPQPEQPKLPNHNKYDLKDFTAEDQSSWAA